RQMPVRETASHKGEAVSSGAHDFFVMRMDADALVTDSPLLEDHTPAWRHNPLTDHAAFAVAIRIVTRAPIGVRADAGPELAYSYADATRISVSINLRRRRDGEANGCRSSGNKEKLSHGTLLSSHRRQR